MQVFSRMIQSIFGDVRWTKPAWFSRVSSLGWKKQLSVVAGSVLVLGGGWWYFHLPKTNYITAQFSPLSIPEPSDEIPTPARLTAKFGYLHGDKLTEQSVIPLATQIGSVVSDIKISPKVEGNWQWLGESSLTFYPKQAWVAGETYHIEFPRKVFAKQVKMQTTKYDFTAAKMQAEIKEFSFYQNPKDFKDQHLVATLQFTYPVDRESLEKNLRLKLQGGFRAVPVTITYGKQDRMAYIHSAPITLGDEAQYYILSIPKNAHAKGSSADLDSEVESKVLIPDAGSLLKVQQVNADIIRNLQGTPEQVLQITTSIGVTQQEMQKTLHVYELPANKPATGIMAEVENYAWPAGEVTPEVLALSKPVTLTAIPDANEFATLHSYKFNGTPGRHLYIRLDKGTVGFGGYKLANDYFATDDIPQYPQEIRFLHQGSLLAKGNEHKLSISVRGLASVHYEIGRILPKEINHLITQTSGSFSNPEFMNWSFNRDDLSEVFSKVEDFSVTDPSKAQYSFLDLDHYLQPNAHNPAPIGLFLIKIEGWDKENKQAIYNTSTTRLVLVTDQALIAKTNFDGSRDVFVSSITNGTPLADAEVSIVGKNGLPLVSAHTDANGHAKLPDLPEENYKNDKQPTVIISKLGNDVSFMSVETRDREINFSKFDIAGITDEVEANNLTAFAFSDRGIYRPGDTAHLGFIIKRAYGLNGAPNLPVEIVITDPSGNTALEQKQIINQDGIASLDFISQANATTGTYNVAVYVTKDEERGSFLGETNILVQDFLPDTMKISGNLNQPYGKGWVSPEKLAVQVQLNNLYGTPSAGHKITGKIVLEPHKFYFPHFQNYTFYDPFEYKNESASSTTIELPETVTNSDGQAKIDLDLSHFQDATFDMKVYLTGFEKTGGRSVKTQVQSLVSPMKYLVGYKSDGDYSFIKQKTPRNVHLIAVNPQLQALGVNNLRLTLLRQSQVATLVQKDNGTYAYETVTQEKPVQKSTISVPGTGLDLPLTTDNVGSYVLVIENSDGMILARIPYTIVGDDNTAVQKNTELSVILNKKEYQPDEEIELQISAPYTGTGLITVERDRVYAYHWFKTTSSKSVQKIKVPTDFVGNGYVNVTFIRDWESPDIFISPLSYSVTPISIDKAKHTLNIQLKAPSKVKSGDNVTVSYQTSAPAKIVVFAVDEGILQAGDYKTPDPLDFFFQKRALNVRTMQIIDLILPKFISDRERMAIGGDGGRKSLEAYLNPFKRKNRPPVVFWSGWIDADQTQKTLSIPVPSSFNGSLRIMAVASGTNQTGHAEAKAVAQNPVILSPNAPTFVAPNDEFDVSVNVTNMMAVTSPATVRVSLKATNGLTVTDASEKSLQLANKQDGTLHYKVRAGQQLGSASLVFTARDATAQQAQLEETLSVRPLSPRMNRLTGGYQAKGTLTLPIDTHRYPQLSETRINAGANPLIFMQGIQGYLDSYPYECTEQLTSRAIVHLMMQQAPTIPNGNAEKLQALMTKVVQRQNGNGSFSYWPGTQDVSSLSSQQQFSSVYAMQFLTEARDAKQIVPLNSLSLGANYLRELAGAEPTDISMARNQAYAIYILTRNEVVTTNYLTNLQLYLEKNQGTLWKQDIVASYIAATYALLHDQKTAEKLIAGYKFNQPIEGDSPFYTAETVDAQYLYLLAKHFPERLKTLGSKGALTLSNRLSQSFISTTSAAMNVMALHHYQNILPSSNAPVEMTQITSSNQRKQSTLLQSQSQLLATDIQKIQLQRAQQLGFFYQLNEKGFANKLTGSISNQGMEIDHQYLGEDGKELTKVKLGQEITVHVTLRNLTQSVLNNIAVVDLLPGGFDIVNGSAVGPFNHQDLREDRAIFFVDLPENQRLEINYKIKAVSPGSYQTPPAFAEDMYNPRVQTLGGSAKITIQE